MEFEHVEQILDKLDEKDKETMSKILYGKVAE